MLMLCLSWGFNQIAVKLVLPDVPPMLQALIRSVGALPVLLIDRLVARREILRARRHAVGRPDCRRDLRHRIRADLSRPAADIGVARGGVSVYRAVLRRARLLCRFSANGCARSQWGGLALSFAGVALAIGVPQANVDADGFAGRPADRRRRRALGGDDADRQGDGADQGPGGKGARLPGRAIDPDPGLRCVDIGRNHRPMFPGRCRCRCWPIRRSGWWV